LTTLKNYVNANSGAPQGGYSPPSSAGSIGYTNWDDAFDKVDALNDTSVAPLVVFITDGDPTTYGPGTDRNTDTDFDADDPRMLNAIIGANEVKAAGSHVLAVGVGASLNNDGSLNRLNQISGSDVYTSGTLNLSTIDVMRVTDFSNFDYTFQIVVTALSK
jgi:hypothetical protein